MIGMPDRHVPSPLRPRAGDVSPAAAPGPARLRPTRVVIVEDDADLRDGLVEYLGASGMDVVGVGCGLHFYEALATSGFDIAVLDITLPDTDGYAIAAFLSARTGLGIVLMTGRARREDRIRGFGSGADLYFVKPVRPREMRLAIVNLARRLRGDGIGQAAVR